MRPIRCLFLTAVLLSPSIAVAAPDKPAPLQSEFRLSEEEKEKVLESAAASRREPVSGQASERADDGGALPPIHGEVGISIGTGGYRSAYGTAIVPLEGEGVAIISLGSTDFGSRGRYYDPWWH